MTARARLAAGTVLAAAVLAALVVAARLGVEDPDERARQARIAEGRLLEAPRGQVVGIEVALGPEVVRLAREADGWRLLAPEEGPADPAAVEAFLDRLRALRRRTALDPGREPALYGLDPPRGRLSLALVGGGKVSLDLGDDAPVGGAFYARAGGGEIVAVPGSAASLVPPAASLRR